MTRTPNVDLTQFNGADTPSWLTDYNGDMLKIDTAIGNTANDATAALGQAEAANAAAIAAGNTAATAAGNASTALATANSSLQSSAQNAINITSLTARTNTAEGKITDIQEQLSGGLNLLKLTQTQFDALVIKDDNTIYFVIAG